MSIKYIPSQIKIDGSQAYGKWFAKMVSAGTVTTEQLANELSHSTTITHADLMCVLYSLAIAIRNHLLSSEKVHLDGLGTFRISIRSHIVDEQKDVGKKLIHACKVAFVPDRYFCATGSGPKGGRTGFYTKKLTDGINFEKVNPRK